ncbi:MAG: penicillin acylase family protein [Caulobacteraceae bacterium]
MKMRLAALFALALTAPALAGPSSAVRHHPLAVPGLQAPATISVDQWGVPHIQATSERDAFFLQGWNAARDRLWQIDLWRKRGLGLLAAQLRPRLRRAGPRRTAVPLPGRHGAEWAAYGPKAQGRAEAFVAGVNAYVGEVRGRAPAPAGGVQAHRQPAGPVAGA